MNSSTPIDKKLQIEPKNKTIPALEKGSTFAKIEIDQRYLPSDMQNYKPCLQTVIEFIKSRREGSNKKNKYTLELVVADKFPGVNNGETVYFIKYTCKDKNGNIIFEYLDGTEKDKFDSISITINSTSQYMVINHFFIGSLILSGMSAGAKILLHLEQIAKKNGVANIIALNVNTFSCDFYTKLGYKISGSNHTNAFKTIII